MEAIRLMQPPKNAKWVQAFLGLVGYYQKFIKTFAHIAKPLTTLMHHDAKFYWTLTHQAVFVTLKWALIQSPILHYPDPSKWYIVYMDASDDACGAQLSQEHKWPWAASYNFLTFTDTQQKWSTPELEACGVYYTIIRWNYYLQGSDIIVHNDHKPLQKFLHGKNSNNKVNKWSLELTPYNITFEWISGAHNKAADCLPWLVEVPRNDTVAASILINSVTVSPADGVTAHTCNRTKVSVEAMPPYTT